MSQTNNPQHQQMSDESMLRNLAAQARAIWPQEKLLVEGYDLPESPAVLDLACGPGELSVRFLELLPGATLLGLDLDRAHLDRARERCAHLDGRARFDVGDAVDLDIEADRFDLAVCRHLLQAVPNPAKVVANMARATKPGGRLHVVAEDYAMMHFAPTRNDTDRFWSEGPIRYAEATGTDLRSGRKVFSMMVELGLRDVRVDYITVDPVRVDREVFAGIWTAWRDGYTDAIAEHTALDRAYVWDCFNDMIDCIRNPQGYAVWQLPVITGVV